VGRGGPLNREALVARHAAGRSFVDVGAMWQVEGAIAFAALAAGATRVTAMDLMPPTPRIDASPIRFVQGDLHDAVVMEEVGEHDVVWCSGVLYHAPHPLLTLERLRSITTQTLLLATEVLPLPGRFAAFAPARWMHPSKPAPLDPEQRYGNWFWLPTPATVRAMLTATGFRIAEEHRTGPFHRTLVAIPF
jgi:hypothetical protein